MISINEQIVNDAKKSLINERFDGVATGFSYLDNKIKGLENGHLIVLGGRPAMGKTTFALSLIENICIRAGKTCVLYSAEKTASEIVQRIIAQHGDVNYRSKDCGKKFRNKIIKSADEVEKAHLWIEDSQTRNVEELIEDWRELGKKEKVDFIVIDYLQLLESGTLDLESILVRLKGLAVELNCPVLVLSQLTRAVENRKYHVPRVSDFANAKVVERISDEIWFLLRPNYYNPTDDEHYAQIIMGKHNTCNDAVIQLYYDHNIPLFRPDEKRA